jgi:hypothetical protein
MRILFQDLDLTGHGFNGLSRALSGCRAKGE